jgi:peptide/nickel transport system substrate-binding protein
MPYCGIVPFEAIEYYGREFSSNPVGTGPFYFKNWRRSDKLVLRRNNFFYQSDDLGISLPYLEAVSIRFIPDRQAAFLEFVKGNLDFLTGIDASYKDQLFTKNGQLKERWLKEYNLYRAPFLNTEFIGIRSTNPSPSYLADSRVRRALNLSIDRISMIRYLKNGIGKAAYGGVIPIGLMGHRKESDWLKPFQYDMDTAISLLTQAGLSTGLNDSILDPIVLSTTSGYRDLCEYLQNAWGNIGIPVQINIMPAASFRDDKSSGSLPVYRASWIADYPDAENYLMLYESKRSAPNGPNSSQFKNKGFDSLLVLGKFATTDSMRVNSFQLADKQLHDESRLIPLIYDESIRVLKKEWRGLPTHPMNWLDLRRTRKLFN